MLVEKPKNKDCISILKTMAQNNDGMLFTKQLTEQGIPRAYLTELRKRGEIRLVSRGVYAMKDAVADEMRVLQELYPKLIYSHETALYLHDLTDVTPSQNSVTVPSGYHVPERAKNKFKIYYAKPEVYASGVEQKTNSFGNEVSVYSSEHTICDVLKSRNRMDARVVSDALKRYAVRKNKDNLELMRFAKMMKVDKLLRQYLEVLI